MNATIRHHVEGLQCPSCGTPLLVTHRYESIHQIQCGNEACKDYSIPYQQPFTDYELKPVPQKHKEARRA